MLDLLDVVVLGLFILAVAVAAVCAWRSDRARLVELRRLEASWAEDLRAADCRRWARRRRQKDEGRRMKGEADA